MNNYEDIIEYYKKTDRLIYLSIKALEKMKHDILNPYARDILNFIKTRPIKDPLDIYSREVAKLSIMQREFERKGEYKYSKYSTIENIDVELYNLRLLLSFITSIHRFEIMEQMIKFIKYQETDIPRTLLSVGVGSGYEIKLCNDYIEHWRLFAYDKGFEQISYASDLLTFFNYSTESLIYEAFPLESDNNPNHKNRYGKIIACELLEHLENPKEALESFKYALHPNGIMFLTMAINIAQEDHIYLYSNVEQARMQVIDSGLKIMDERVTPQTIIPFKDSKRPEQIKSGNYICIVKKD